MRLLTRRPIISGSASFPEAFYCSDLVRRFDRDRYFLTLSQAPRHRAGLFALFAFNHEIAKTREVVSDPTLGLIRLQWWREAIDKMLKGQAVDHEALRGLARVYAPYERSYDFLRKTKDDFFELIDAREFDLENVSLSSLDALEIYAEKTSSPLNRLALRLMGQAEGEVRAVSIAYALTGLLRAQPFLKERAFFPHGLSAADTAHLARSHLAATPHVRGFLKANAMLASLYLCRMKRLRYELNDPRLNLPPISFSLAALAGRFR